MLFNHYPVHKDLVIFSKRMLETEDWLFLEEMGQFAKAYKYSPTKFSIN